MSGRIDGGNRTVTTGPRMSNAVSSTGGEGRWLPRVVGAGAIGLFLSGGVLFAQRLGALPRFQSRSTLENELADATSPYLRSAAEQPVAWQQWGERAFRLAVELDRPIWLDIGAVWCHWCHVMDRESYEDSSIAALINASFVPIKVDRDERPDIDARYQVAHQALTGRGGGWPLTMFLTPTGEPFAGGTYFPPETRDGLLGIREIAPRVAGLFAERRGDVEAVGAQVRTQLAAFRRNAFAAGELDPDLPLNIVRGFAAEFDTVYGGLGNTEGSKFAHGGALRLALAVGFLEEDDGLVTHALHALDAYAVSGMRDYVHGGFFRYSTDRRLTVPHFEKMDYVQAELLGAYLDAYRLTGRERYAEAARDIMRYVNETLSDRRRGGFYAHQDADVTLDDDGSYYTWSLVQLRAAVTPEQAAALELFYDVGAVGEMREDAAQNVLRVARSPEQVARALAISLQAAQQRVVTGTARLAEVRRAQPAPFVETTSFTDRNGTFITAYLDAYVTLGDTVAREFALRTVDRLLEQATRRDGTVWHATAGDTSYVDGFMADYASLANALLDAYQVSGRERYLRAAARIMDRAVALFWDEEGDGFFDRRADPDAPALLADRAREFLDTPLPGDNAVAALALGKLYLLTSDDRWRDLAERTLAAFAGRAVDAGMFAATYGLALETHLRKPPQTVVIGPRENARTVALAMAAWRSFRPGRLVAVYDPATVVLDSLPEAVAGAAQVFADDPTPRAYVCVGATCAPPTSDPAEVRELVRRYGLRGSL